MIEQSPEASPQVPRKKGGTTRRFLAAMMKLPDTAMTKLIAATARLPAELEGMITEKTIADVRHQLKIHGVFDQEGVQRTSALETRNALSFALSNVPETTEANNTVPEELMRYFAAKIGLNISFGV